MYDHGGVACDDDGVRLLFVDSLQKIEEDFSVQIKQHTKKIQCESQRVTYRRHDDTCQHNVVAKLESDTQ